LKILKSSQQSVDVIPLLGVGVRPVDIIPLFVGNVSISNFRSALTSVICKARVNLPKCLEMLEILIDQLGADVNLVLSWKSQEKVIRGHSNNT
jgi:hypothetical protein